jgi:hypothetical protein
MCIRTVQFLVDNLKIWFSKSDKVAQVQKHLRLSVNSKTERGTGTPESRTEIQLKGLSCKIFKVVYFHKHRIYSSSNNVLILLIGEVPESGILTNFYSIFHQSLQPNVGQGKGEVVPVLNDAARHEGVWVSGGIAPCILNLGTRRWWLEIFTPSPPCYPLDMRLDRSHSRFERGGEEKRIRTLPGI